MGIVPPMGRKCDSAAVTRGPQELPIECHIDIKFVKINAFCFRRIKMPFWVQTGHNAGRPTKLLERYTF